MTKLNSAAEDLIASGALAHLVTIEPDGSPQVSCVWVGVEDSEVVFASLGPRRKLDNLRRDPRVTLSMQAPERNPMGLQHYLVIHGRARLTEGGGPELLSRLAQIYVGSGTRFPPMDDPPPGIVVRIQVERVGGVGDWTS